MTVINAARESYGDDMGAFLCFMGVRLLEMRRVLRDTGSIYLHCDPTASHYLKMLMDAIYGQRNFRNEVTWKRRHGFSSAVHKSVRFGVCTDILLFYGKSEDAKFHPQYNPNSPEYRAYVEKHFTQVDEDGRRYQANNLANPNYRPNLIYEYKGYPPPENGWTITKKKMEQWDKEGRIHFPKNQDGRLRRKSFSDELKGMPLQNLWDDIHMVTLRSKEGTGYPTQKPLALYERIISASSNSGDIVLDPFAGCATTSIAAEKLGRQWVGMDIWDGAYDVVVQRLNDNRQLLNDIPTAVSLVSVPPQRTDSGEAATPYLQVTEKYAEPGGTKMSRAEMYGYLLAQYGPKCQGCDRTFDDSRYLELDHNTPRSDGGLNHISNRILLCSPCNRAKSNTYTLSGLRKVNKKNDWMVKG